MDKKLMIYIIVALLFAFPGKSNGAHLYTNDSTAARLESIFDNISYRWDILAENLEQYSGLSSYCLQKDFREEVITVLEDIHHFDSLIYKRLKVIASRKHNGEINKTVRQIEELESEFGIKSFTSFLLDECKERKSVEKSRKDYVGDYGQSSYDGQKKLIENSLHRYVHHVTHLVDHVRKHIHHLHIDKEI